MAGLDDTAAAWVPPGLAQLFEVVLDAAARGRIGDDDLAIFESAGAHAAETGASLSALIDAYLTGAGELWENLFTEPTTGASTVELGRVLRQISERAVAALAEGFELTQRRRIRVEETARRELIGTLLTGGPIDPLWFEDQAAVAGFPQQGPYQVLVAAPEDALVEADASPAQMQSRLEQRQPAIRWVTLIWRGELVMIAAGIARPFSAVVAAALADDPRPGWYIGVGDVQASASGIQASYRQASEAQRLARTFGRAGVAEHSELLVERLLSGRRAVVEQLHSRFVRPLEEVSRGDLLETLQTFLDCGGNTAEVARRLSVGTRTIGYRLERIADVTGCSPRDPEQRLLLDLAMRARPLMNQP